MNDMISIIVPVYKCESYLRKCLDSIISQTYNHLEIILIDDGSPDNCPFICDEYASMDQRIKVIHKHNGGVSSARNTGIQEATGQYIQFVDSDDYLNPNMCKLLAENITGFDIVMCGYNIVVDTKIICNCIKNKAYISPGDLADDFGRLLNQYYFHSCFNKLFRKDLVRELFDESLDMGEDLIFNLNYLRNCQPIHILEECLYNYRKSSNSLTTKFRENIFEIEKKLYLNIDAFYRLNFKNEFSKPTAAAFIKNTYYIMQSCIRQNKAEKIEDIVNDELFQAIIKKMKFVGFRYYFVIIAAKHKDHKSIANFFRFKLQLLKLLK